MTDNPFEKVLDRLRKKGWTKNDFGLASGPNCIRGAAGQVGLNPWQIITYIRDFLRAEYPERTCTEKETCAQFNDHPDTTFTDVERVLEKAAVKWEEERVLRHD